jgi:hypothetical protein
VVWPVVALWTSREVPVMAAMVPDVPGFRGVVAPLDAPPAPDVLVDGAEADEDAPHAASTTAATPRPERASALRRRPRSEAPRSPVVRSLLVEVVVT